MYGVLSWKCDHLRNANCGQRRSAQSVNSTCEKRPHASNWAKNTFSIHQLFLHRHSKRAIFAFVSSSWRGRCQLRPHVHVGTADGWCRWLAQGHVYNFILKFFEPNLANETTREIGPLTPSPFGGRNSQVWLYIRYCKSHKFSSGTHFRTFVLLKKSTKFNYVWNFLFALKPSNFNVIFFEALESTKISSDKPVSSQKYENGYRTNICDFTVFPAVACICFFFFEILLDLNQAVPNHLADKSQMRKPDTPPGQTFPGLAARNRSSLSLPLSLSSSFYFLSFSKQKSA